MDHADLAVENVFNDTHQLMVRHEVLTPIEHGRDELVNVLWTETVIGSIC